MKKQIKTLSDEEKYAICNKYMRDDEGNIISYYCRGLECPLSFVINDDIYCFKNIPALELKIKEYLDSEVDVDVPDNLNA